MHLPILPAARDIDRFGKRHRLALVLGFVAVLCGTAITALAVAPLAPDAADLPQRLVIETLSPPDLQSQLDELAAHEFTLTRNDITRSTDTAEELLARMGVRDHAATLFLRTDPTARRLLSGRGGKMVQVHATADGQLQDLVARYPSDLAEQSKTHFNRLSIRRGADGNWQASLDSAAYTTQSRLASGTIRNTLFGATDEAGLPDSVALQLAEIFSTDIDFHRELRKGDTFSVVYEALQADGEAVAWQEGAGRVLAAGFDNAGRQLHAVWFAPTGGAGGYFDIDGRSKRRTFLASPLAFSRVTSGFAMRFHPLLQTWRRHLGVDYGAPTGTPVRTVGDGVVGFAGRQNGYGNIVQIEHGNGRSTLYAHLSRINVRKGQRLRQGDLLGAVGSTGWATGPHLHFEFRTNGRHQDPLRVARTSEALSLDLASRPHFDQVARTVQANLQVAQTLVGRSVQSE